MFRRVTREMIDLWRRLWLTAQRDLRFWPETIHELDCVIVEIKERYPDDWHDRMTNNAGDEYFNIGCAQWCRMWQEVYLNGF